MVARHGEREAVGRLQDQVAQAEPRPAAERLRVGPAVDQPADGGDQVRAPHRPVGERVALVARAVVHHEPDRRREVVLDGAEVAQRGREVLHPGAATAPDRRPPEADGAVPDPLGQVLLARDDLPAGPRAPLGDVVEEAVQPRLPAQVEVDGAHPARAARGPEGIQEPGALERERRGRRHAAEEPDGQAARLGRLGQAEADPARHAPGEHDDLAREPARGGDPVGQLRDLAPPVAQPEVRMDRPVHRVLERVGGGQDRVPALREPVRDEVARVALRVPVGHAREVPGPGDDHDERELGAPLAHVDEGGKAGRLPDLLAGVAPRRGPDLAAHRASSPEARCGGAHRSRRRVMTPRRAPGVA